MTRILTPPPPAVSHFGPGPDRMRAEVLAGLRRPRKRLPCKYFYDAAGSRLFDEICELDEYYLTRTELAIMHAHAGEMAEAIGGKALLVEYGSGSSTKTRIVLDHIRSPAGYVPIDISGEHLAQSASASGAARRAFASSVVGQRRAGGAGLWRRRRSARDAHLRSASQRVALDEAEVPTRTAQRRPDGLRRRPQGACDVRLAVYR